MASITDCVVEGLKYPFNDVKMLLALGGLFAVLNLISLSSSMTSFNIFRTIVHEAEKTNSTLMSMQFSHLPVGDIKFVIGLVVISLIISLFIMGYQYNLVKFSIDRRNDFPGFLDVLDIFLKGIKYFIVTVAYNIIPVILIAVGIVCGDPIFTYLTLISMILFIFVFFLLIMALNNMIAHDDIKKAFDFSEIIGNISNLGWARYIGIIIFTLIVFMIIMVACGFVLSVLSVAFAALINNQAVAVSAFITVIEGLFVTSYCSVFYNRVCGSIYRESIK